MAIFCSLFSGSSGNCSYLESGGAGILIDAGVSTRSIVRALESLQSSLKKIAAIFITHEHSDHIKGLPVLTARYGLPVYAYGGTLEGIIKSARGLDRNRPHEIPTGGGLELAGMYISSFPTSHDSNESVGYKIHTADGHEVAVATDLGLVSDTVKNELTGCKLVMLESNHDVAMLKNGRYPYFLKRRILSPRGHLSNDDCAAALPELVKGGTQHLLLAHLRRDNNLPELAEQTSVANLLLCGGGSGDYTSEAAPRLTRSRAYNL